MHRTIIIISLLLFGALSAIALWQHGYLGIFESQLQSFGTGQVLADLVIALTMVMIWIWIWHDAKSAGRSPWPWIVATLTLGAFGPLVYLLTRKR